MPTSVSLSPKNGAIAYGTFAADFTSFQIKASQSVENVTPYGTNTACKNVGNATPDFNFNISAFALAHNANTAPSIAGGTASAFNTLGYATTFTLDTLVTEACNMVVESITLGHARMRAAVNYDITGKNESDMVEVWPLT